MGRIKKKKNKKWFMILLVIGIFSALIGSYLGGLGKAFDINAETNLSIHIPKGASTDKIATILEDKGIIKRAFDFKLVSKINDFDGKFKNGDYILSPSMNMEEIAKIIIKGNSSVTRFTIPEGLTLNEVSEKLAKDGIVNMEEFKSTLKTAEFKNYKIYEDVPDDVDNRLEGFLYPDTYEIFTSANSYDVMNKMIGHLDKLLTKDDYLRAFEMNYSMYDILTIASMIQRETLIAGEKPLVASVIYNRLKKDMPLQIDATVQYALPEHKDRLSYEDLKIDSPYNTYKYKGLPKGPICSPDIDSIKAALYPEYTGYLYYVLSPEKDGTHNFSETYDEFLSNKQKYINSL